MEDDDLDGYITAITENSIDNIPIKDTHTVIDQDHQKLITLQQADIHLRDIIADKQRNTTVHVDKKHQKSSKDDRRCSLLC